MRVLIINSVCGLGSTGRICRQQADELTAHGHEVKIAYGRGNPPVGCEKYGVRIGSGLSVAFHGVRTRIFDGHGQGSKAATEKFLTWADSYDPEILYLHNLHGYYIQVEKLFEWIKSRPEMKVVWMLHDCWAFTGHCAYFSYADCGRWERGCYDCPEKRRYPASFLLDNSYGNYERKKRAFTGVSQLVLRVPSQWLGELVSRSFLREYPLDVCLNPIDLTVFRPRESEQKARFGLEGKKVILGVASVWDARKGLDVFRKLAKDLDERCVIVLVGLSSAQRRKMPGNIVSIPLVDNDDFLAELYSAADVFLNPSREESFGMTTVEALSCGTPAVVLRNTAGAEIAEKYGGVAVEMDIEAVKAAVYAILFDEETC